MKKDNKFGKKSELRTNPAKSGNTGQRETKEVLAELVGRLREKLNPKVASVSPSEQHRRGDLKPNLDRLTVGVDLGDQWSKYCILDLQGETLAEGSRDAVPTHALTRRARAAQPWGCLFERDQSRERR